MQGHVQNYYNYNDCVSMHFNRVDCQHVMRCAWHSLCTIHEHACQLVSAM